MRKQQKKKKITPIKKPFLVGQPTDATTTKRAVSVLGTVLVSMFIYLVVGPVLISDNAIVRVLIGVAFVAMFTGLCYSNGVNAGFQDVTFSEIAYQRKESAKPLDAGDEKKCYNKLKGLVSGLIGVVPLFLLALILAFVTTPQLYTISALPSWLSGLERRTEIGNALLYYHEGSGIGVMDIIRIVIRLAVMPFVTMVSSDNIMGVLWVERLSPILVLLPALGYALGYLQGPNARARVHGDIAASERKKKKREKKRLEQKRKGPEQLV